MAYISRPPNLPGNCAFLEGHWRSQGEDPLRGIAAPESAEMGISQGTTAIALMLAALVGLCSSHLCLLSPPQRGGFGPGLNTPGSEECFAIKGPCGAKPLSVPIQIRAGTNFTVIFQKNLDHWNKNDPGFFSVSLGKTKTASRKIAFKEVGHVTDAATPSLHLYSVNITIPVEPATYVLQVIYETKNPSAPPAFYQCADFSVASKWPNKELSPSLNVLLADKEWGTD